MATRTLEDDRKAVDEMAPSAAADILTKAEGHTIDFRSCWYCNGAHYHLIDREALRCFACGTVYVSGWPARWIVARANGEPVSDALFAEVRENIREANE